MGFKFADLYKDKKLFNLAYNNAKSTVAENKSFELLLDIFKYSNRLQISVKGYSVIDT
nr:hypothetical protein [Wolbachia endosymbiont of Litomosoides sigmodontis]